MPTNCFSFAPRDSVPGLIAKICKYLKNHPGWSDEELEDEIRRIIGETSVESFNGRTGAVVLNEEDVNNLKIASAYFAEGDESINDLDVAALYNQGVRFVFTNWNSVTSGYDLAFVLDYFSGSNDVVYYPMSTGSGGGGNIVSVNGKTGIVELSLSDILGDSGAQVKLCTATEFTSNTLETWNAYYDDGYRIIGVVNSGATAIDYLYLLKQDENNHQPIGLSAGASDAYTPSNPPPYPVTSVNGLTGDVTLPESSSGVSSVNGKTGAVTGVYDVENPPPYPVISVNGKTGRVIVDRIETDKGFTQIIAATSQRTPAINVKGRGDFLGREFAIYYDDNDKCVIARVAYPVVYDTARFIKVYTDITPPPYPVTSVNSETGNITVRRIYSADGNALIRQINPDATHARAFYSESTFGGVKSLISCFFDENDYIHMQIKHGDDSWRDAILYTTKNPPPSSSSSLGHALVTTETIGESNNRHIVYYSQLPGIFNESINSIISVMPVGQGAFYLRPKYYSNDAFELKVYGDLTDIDYQLDVQIVYEV